MFTNFTDQGFPFSKVVKRFFDLILCVLGAFLFLPAFLVLTIYLKMIFKNNIIFKQQRIGENGKPFILYKYKTMNDNICSDKIHVWTQEKEDRIIYGGRFIRDYGLDELPQLFNIIKGNMSLIGPRPLIAETIKLINPNDLSFLKMKPGVLSLPAVNGRRMIPMQQRIEINNYYFTNWNLLLDLHIICKSLKVVLFRHGVNDNADNYTL